jgi:oligopeptide/dipeptide ABC transporter ATP-binding protein
MADEVAVMYAGRIVEHADVHTLFAAPRHPYTAGLLRSIPSVAGRATGALPVPIPGAMPRLGRWPAGCAFQPRCARADAARCGVRLPALELASPGHQVRCVRHGEPEAPL